MTRIAKLFADKHNILSIYTTAGYPNLADTIPVMKAIEQAGADMIELGMPYSDPLADGPVIQASGSKAIANGMSIETLFTQIKDMRQDISVPVILMGYMNPVIQYGFERFCQEAAACGVDGLILPDLPVYEFETIFGQVIKKYNLDFIFMVTPETSETRIRKLDACSSGFLYAVSSSSTTGQQATLHTQSAHFERLKAMKLNNPVMIGFGIRTREHFETASKLASGAIIGTAFVEALGNEGDSAAAATSFVKGILPA